MLNMTTDEAELVCSEIDENWTSNFYDKWTTQGCYDDLFLARLCPKQFCPEAAAAMELERHHRYAKKDLGLAIPNLRHTFSLWRFLHSMRHSTKATKPQNDIPPVADWNGRI